MFQKIVDATEPMVEADAISHISNNAIRKEIVMYVLCPVRNDDPAYHLCNETENNHYVYCFTLI